MSLLSGKVYAIPDLFNPKDTEPLTRYIHQMAANVFHIDQKVAYEIISAIGGGLFLLFYLLFVLRLEGSVSWKILLVILGLSGGANQLFFGHVEDYTLVYVCSILFLIAGWQLFEGNATLGTMIVLFVVGVRLHVQMVLLAPALLYAVLHHRRRLSPKFERWIEPKRLFAGVALSVVCATLAYFFYFHADRYLVNDQAERFQKVFLPLVNPLPPPHYYTLFSIGHLSDVAQEFLLTVSPVAIMVLWLVIKFYRRVDWRQPRIMFFGLAVFYFQLFNLTVNPLLTMERDWDMLSLAAAPAMFLAIALSHQLFEKKLSSAEWATTTGVALAGAVLSCTIFYLNTTEQCVGSRFLGIGKWAFRSYYQGSSYLINVGEGMISDKDEQIARGDKTIRELLPDASMPDFELANLYHKMGNLLYAG
ncbi:MAG: hypothetical protein HY277_06675, partial [Ignavibacteriales bacterium]|nr:hypothetical protein [Ignavibacteriales bacterium]